MNSSRVVFVVAAAIASAAIAVGLLLAFEDPHSGTPVRAAESASHAAGQTEAEFELIPVGQVGGAIAAYAREDDLAFLVVGPRLIVLDWSDPQTPLMLSDGLRVSDMTSGIAVSDAYLYVADIAGGLRVIDVTTPEAPEEIGAMPVDGFYHSVEISGGLAYALGFEYATVPRGLSPVLRVIDVTDPISPTLRGVLSLPEVGRDLFVVGDLAYVADGGSGLLIVDTSDPDSPEQLGAYDTVGSAARGVAVDNAVAYVATAGPVEEADALLLLDVSAPDSPIDIESLMLPAGAEAIDVADGYAFVATDGAGLRVIDVSNPEQPLEAGYFDAIETIGAVDAGGGYARVIADDRLTLIEVAAPDAPMEAGSYRTTGWSWDVQVVGDYAYMASESALWVIDASSPMTPTIEGTADVALGASSVRVSDGYAYVPSGEDGVHVIDVMDPGAPWTVATLDTPGQAWSIDIAGDELYVADGAEGLVVADITSPDAPQEVGFLELPGRATAVDVANGFAFVAASDEGLRVVDVSSPISPTEVVALDDLGDVQDVYWDAGRAFLACEDGLRVFDVTDPLAPTEIGFAATDGPTRSVYVADGYAYLAVTNGASGLQVYDVTSPADPALVYYDPYETSVVENVYVVGDLLYAADTLSGLRVFRIVAPQPPEATPTPDVTPAPTPIRIQLPYAGRE